MAKVFRLLRNNAGLLVFLTGMFMFRSAVADWNHIPSGSMEPALQIGDRVAVDHRAYAWRVPFTRIHLVERSSPAAGEVITFASPVDGGRWIKRVVAVAGDRVEGRSGWLWVNGRAMGSAGRLPFGPLDVPPGHVFVMGDNRDHSLDSRYWGPLSVDRIYGRAFKVVLSFDGMTPRTDRWWRDIFAAP